VKKVVLISCTKEKRNYPCEAYKLYDESSLFKKSYAYAHTVSSEIYIISAKYGLVPEYQMIAPYDETLNTKGIDERREWGRKTAAQIRSRFDVESIEFVLLAGSRYCEPLIPYLKYYSMPLEGMPLGKRMQVLDEWLMQKKPQPAGHEMKCAEENCTSTQEIFAFIQNKLRTLSYSGQKSVQLTSGSIAKEMNIKNRMPMVCSAMRKAMKAGDRVVYAPPKGNGTTLTIEYKL
jgi:hypothetical protein